MLRSVRTLIHRDAGPIFQEQNDLQPPTRMVEFSEKSQKIRHEPVVAQTSSVQFNLEFLVAIFTLTTHRVLVVYRRRNDPTARPICDHGPSIRPLSMCLGLDHNRLRLRPSLRLIINQHEQPLRLIGLLILFRRLLLQVFTQVAKPGIHADSEGVSEPQLSADIIQFRNAQTRVTPNMNLHVGPDSPKSCREISQVVINAERGMTGSHPQPNECSHLIFGTRDDRRKILKLFIVSVKQAELLVTMRGVVECVDIKSDMMWKFIKRLDELVSHRVAQPPEIGNRHSVFEA